MTDLTRPAAVGNFSRGLLHPFRAFGFIRRQPRLYPYVVIPFTINLAVFSLAVFLGLRFFNQLAVDFIPQGDAWYWIFLHYATWVVAVLLTMVLVFFSFTAVGSLIASPFNDILSERTEEILSGVRNDEPFVFRVFLQDLKRTLFDESKKILLFVLGMIFLLGLNLLPGIGSALYGVLSVLWTIFFLVVEYTGYVFGRKHLGFKDQRRFILGHKLLLLGFGSGLLAILAIPFLQFCAIPLGVVGATRIYFETQQTMPEIPPS